MKDIEQLKPQISQLKTEGLDRKADEELKMNEKLKEINALQRQFHDAVVHEQETKMRQSQAHNERLHRMQEDNKDEVEKVKAQHHREFEALEAKIPKSAIMTRKTSLSFSRR